jgi:hypothetical protein
LALWFGCFPSESDVVLLSGKFFYLVAVRIGDDEKRAVIASAHRSLFSARGLCSDGIDVFRERLESQATANATWPYGGPRVYRAVVRWLSVSSISTLLSGSRGDPPRESSRAGISPSAVSNGGIDSVCDFGAKSGNKHFLRRSMRSCLTRRIGLFAMQQRTPGTNQQIRIPLF